MAKANIDLLVMIYAEIDEFRMWPDGVLAKAGTNVVTIRENGLRLGVLIPPDLYDLYQLYEEEHWARSARDKSPPLSDED